jgi:succinate dehydrogenase hydrophobic membrane anchor protein
LVDAARDRIGAGSADTMVRRFIDRACRKRLRRFHPVATRAPFTTVVMVLLLIALFYHMGLGLQVVVEDYVHTDRIKIPAVIAIHLASFALAAAGIVATLRIALGGSVVRTSDRKDVDDDFVERMLPVARERLVTIRHDALLTKAARLLDERHTNLVVVCDDGGARAMDESW